MKMKAMKAYGCFNGPHLVSASKTRADACKATADKLGQPWRTLRGSIKCEKILVVRGALP